MPLLLVLALCMGAAGVAPSAAAPPAVPAGATQPGDLDARLLPWAALRRVALLAGQHPPAEQPISRRELAALVAAARAGAAADGDQAFERTLTALESLAATQPAERTADARLLAGFTERGGLQPGEAGLAWAPGWNLAAEGAWQAARGPWWAAAAARLTARTGAGGSAAFTSQGGDDPLDWPGWDPATGPAAQRRALGLGRGAELDLARAIVGREAGSWSMSLGWEPRRTGPGLGGALLLDREGPPFGALTVRRNRPVVWDGWLRPLGPQSLLFRAGMLDERTMADPADPAAARRGRPWFFQWLVRWRVTDWARLGFTHAAVAAARSGSLWPDLLQVNFPTAGVTWDEHADGPLTDRLFAAQLEFRWRDAPWPLLPARAGRAWWEYAGTDFLPRGPAGLLPEISAPASIAGFELVGTHWDLACEYAETLHPLVLWYANGAFPGGYAHRGWLLGTSLGGAGERIGALIRGRDARCEAELGLERTEWGAEGHSPSLARERHAWLAAAPLRDGLPGPWRARVDWRRSESLSPAGGAARRWWALSLERRF